MALLSILQYPDPKLKITGETVKDFGEATQSLIDDMVETLYNTQNCAGLAAVQLGVSKQITVIDFSQKKDNLLILVNPKISDPRGTTNTPEGCMSVGINLNVSARVRRAEKIYVKAQDRHGKVIKFDADGFLAKCIQHEVDHLNGILYIDRLGSLARSFVERKLKKRIKRH